MADDCTEDTKVDKKYQTNEDKGIQCELIGMETTYVDNVFVGIIGIDDYGDVPNCDNLKRVRDDINKSIDLWTTYFGYDTYVLSQYFQNKINKRTKIYTSDITDFLGDVRYQYKTKSKLKYKYDALIIMIFGHGAIRRDGEECLVTSGGNLVSFEKIRRYFSAEHIGTDRAVTSIRIFIIDVCRGQTYAHVITVPTRGVNTVENLWKHTSDTNVNSNICTFYSTTRGIKVEDNGLLTTAISDVMKNVGTDLKYYTLDDIFTKVQQLFGTKYVDVCPEFVSTCKFKIKLRRSDKAEITYRELGDCKIKPERGYEFKPVPADKAEDIVVEDLDGLQLIDNLDEVNIIQLKRMNTTDEILVNGSAWNVRINESVWNTGNLLIDVTNISPSTRLILPIVFRKTYLPLSNFIASVVYCC